MSIESINKCREYPDDDKEYGTLTIRNHWNRNDRVVLELNGKEIGVFLSDDLIRAITNAVNAHKF